MSNRKAITFIMDTQISVLVSGHLFRLKAIKKALVNAKEQFWPVV